MSTVDLSVYPAAPFLLFSKTLDLLCDSPLQCQSWRDYVPIFREQLSWKVGNVVAETFPPTLTYQEFLEGRRESSLEQVYKYAFETPSTALADLTTPTACMVLVLLVLLIRSLKSILLPFFSQLGRKAGRRTHGPEWEAQNEIRIVKFGEYVFRLLYHTFISTCGIVYFWDKPWWKPGGTTSLWLDFPFQPIEPGMTWYYLVQSAYNIEAMISLLELSFELKWNKNKVPIGIGWSKTVRGDFREMLVHHVVTNLLIVGSSFFRFTRIGSMVFLVHDITDVPVDLSKLANFVKWKRATATCFASMVFSWAYFRLGILPFVIYKSVLLESPLLLKSGHVNPIYFVAYRHGFYVLVGLIIFLHVAWFVMFIRMGYLLIRKGEAHDLSEHKTGEPQAVMNGTSGNPQNGTTGNPQNGHGTANGKKQH